MDNSPTGFFTGCERGRISSYCFLEPRYSSSVQDGILLPQNDQHPDADVREGDNLVRRVYEAIRANDDIWNHCIFVITWDEHGGLYDHVAPPPATYPGDKVSTDPPFNFDRYGVRVPAIVVSPYVKAGKIEHDTVFDHTSLPATAAELFLHRALTADELHARAAQANSVTVVLDPDLLANGPRQDRVVIPDAAAPPPQTPGPLNDLQAEHLQQAIALEQELPPDSRTGIDPTKIETDVEADNYIRQVFAAALTKGIGG